MLSVPGTVCLELEQKEKEEEKKKTKVERIRLGNNSGRDGTLVLLTQSLRGPPLENCHDKAIENTRKKNKREMEHVDLGHYRKAFTVCFGSTASSSLGDVGVV